MLERVKEELRELIEQRRWTELSSKKREWPDADSIAPDVVDLLHSLDKTDRVLFFRSLPRELEAAVFSYLEGESRDALMVDLTDQEARRILANLPPDDRTDLLSELPGELTQRLLNLLGPDDLLEARQLLGYPEDSVGRLMTPDYVAVRRAWTVAQALEHIRVRGKKSETVDIVYVVDRHWKLLDALPLKDFIFADPQAQVESLMDYSVVSLSAYDDREEAVRMIQRYDRVALPVVDSEGVLLGIVTVDDVLDVAEEEFTEDFQRFSAMEPLRQGYWESTVAQLVRSRIGWLASLVMVSLISSGVIGIYEDVLAQVLALAFFMPLVIGTGGNAGTQAATMMIRSMSIGDVAMRDWFRAFARELLVGVLLGAGLGLLGLGLGMFRGGFEVGLVVFLTMLTMLTLTNLLGMSLPFLLTLFRQDPASASGPLVASIADAIGLLVYFSIARAVFQF